MKIQCVKIYFACLLVIAFSNANPLIAQTKPSKTKADTVKQNVRQHDPPITRAVDTLIGEGGNTHDFDMAPETTIDVVENAIKHFPTKLPQGPVKPAWHSLQENYRVPQWFIGAKFGIFMHWGLYAVPAYNNEWYEKFMYQDSATIAWHREHFGDHTKFGYKDFIPLFTQEKFNPDEWATLFKKAGARYVIPSAQHHDNFALWESKVTPFNAKIMGPKRDLIGELCNAVRKQGMKFGVSNHGIENFQFINPTPDITAKLKAANADIYDAKWKNFYNVADRSDEACEKFLINWFERNVELIDKYQPDILWFDNGIDQRYLDALKLQIAAYYYNRAKKWGKEVSISSKKAAYAPAGTNITTIGSILDFEARVPPGIRTGVWQVDRPIATSWGYTTNNFRMINADGLIASLADIVSKNGTLLFNISPKADGSIPDEQQQVLLGVGKWLDVNSEAIYDTHNWIKFGEDSPQKTRFTVKGNALYAIILGKWPGNSVLISSLAANKGLEGKIASVSILGSKEYLSFSQDETGLKVALPATPPCEHAYTLKIIGLKMNAPTWTVDGNPLKK